ncbi:GWxTD domain-containing protein [Aureibacter tunicatorum]|uniref:GWxTD domain-containing protein n=1 Tax=Aureibacter tunicatorum TaxID=866807 RepID=A0AAE4BRG7_9BACT|nr:GWxTD domain-containing protein [Aureibacter tunicatorum]MDR6238646.1 GWxTD domain-containing protein [Aureibacter tunicatorum]
MYLKFALPKNEINKLVILHVKTLDGRHQYLYDINLNDKSKQIDMENFEFDFLKSYISLNKIDAINTPSLNHQHVRLAIPEKELKEALPAIEATHNKQNYEDSTYFIPLIEASTSSQEGLYILQSDFQPNNKQYLVKGVENDFPKYNEIEDLIGPIKYIATKKEYEKISKSIDPKKSFDKFWISLTRSEKRAQYHVKKFYKQVTNANKLFTNLKDGWKTDRGMVYIIFGPPNEVYKNGKKEEWTYLTVDNFKIKFTFVNKKSLLSGSEYKLKRRKRYKRVWLREKDLWRNDRKEI